MEVQMATTRIIPMHINKGETIMQCMKARIDYVKNPDKTEDGELISAYACAPKTAAEDEMLRVFRKLSPKKKECVIQVARTLLSERLENEN